MFDVIIDLFRSELGQKYLVVIIVLLLLAFFLGGFLVWLYATKIHMKLTLNKAADLEKERDALAAEKAGLEKRCGELEEQNRSLLEINRKGRFFQELRMEREPSEPDEVLEQFVPKS